MSFVIPYRFREDYDAPPRDLPERDELLGIEHAPDLCAEDRARIDALFAEVYPELYPDPGLRAAA